MGVREVSFDDGRWVKLASHLVLRQAFIRVLTLLKLWSPLPKN